MALADIIAAVNTRLTGVTAKFGSEFIGELTAPPRLTWVPISDQFGPPRRLGSPSNGLVPAAHQARTVKTRRALVDLHLWAAGADGDSDAHKHLRATEALINRVVWHLHAVAHGSYELEDGEWQQAATNTHGRGYILHVRFDLPVTPLSADDSKATVVVSNIPREGSYTAAALGQKDATNPDPHDWVPPP